MRLSEWIKVAFAGLLRAIQSRDLWRIKRYFYWLRRGIVFGERRLLSKDEIIHIDSLDGWEIVGHPGLSNEEKERFIYGESLSEIARRYNSESG